MSLLLPEPGLLFWMVLVFAIVFFILAKWGFPVITGMIDKRNDYISESLSQAEEARRRLSQMEEEHRGMIESTKKEQARILKEAQQARAEMLEKAREDAQVQAADIIARAREQIESEKESALAEVRTETALLGVAMAEKILRRSLEGDEAQKALLDTLADEAFGRPES